MVETMTPWAEEDLLWLQGQDERRRERQAAEEELRRLVDGAEDVLMRKAHARHAQKLAEKAEAKARKESAKKEASSWDETDQRALEYLEEMKRGICTPEEARSMFDSLTHPSMHDEPTDFGKTTTLREFAEENEDVIDDILRSCYAGKVQEQLDQPIHALQPHPTHSISRLGVCLDCGAGSAGVNLKLHASCQAPAGAHSLANRVRTAIHGDRTRTIVLGGRQTGKTYAVARAFAHEKKCRPLVIVPHVSDAEAVANVWRQAYLDFGRTIKSFRKQGDGMFVMQAGHSVVCFAASYDPHRFEARMTACTFDAVVWEMFDRIESIDPVDRLRRALPRTRPAAEIVLVSELDKEPEFAMETTFVGEEWTCHR